MNKIIALEILRYSHYEHYKALKDMAQVLPFDHPKRKKYEETINDILKKINELENDGE